MKVYEKLSKTMQYFCNKTTKTRITKIQSLYYISKISLQSKEYII